MHAEGKLKELHRELGFLHRFPALFKQCPEIKDLLFRNFGFQLGLKHPRAWLPAKEEVFETPLERRRLEGRREFEGRLALVQHGAARAEGGARL